MNDMMPMKPGATGNGGGMPGEMPRGAFGLGAGMRSPGTQGVEDQSEQASPEEQKQYDMFVSNAMKLMYDPKSFPKLMQSMDSGADPVDGLANAAAMVVSSTEQSMRQSGMEMDDEILLNAGSEIVEQLADLSKESTGKEFSQNDINSALYRGVDLYREMKTNSGQIDRGKYEQEFAQMVEADKNGTLEQMIPQKG